MVAIGPVLLVGYLFDATKGVTDRWIGKLITYSILTLLINVTLNVVLQGEKLYMRAILTQQASGVAANIASGGASKLASAAKPKG